MNPAADLQVQLSLGDPGAISEQELGAWIQRQRWFGSKARDVGGFHVAAAIPLTVAPTLLALLLVEARFRGGTHDIYQVLVGARPAEGDPGEEVITRAGDVEVFDALRDPDRSRALLGLINDEQVVQAPRGTVSFHLMGEGPGLAEEPLVRALDGEQSNSSIVFDERLVLKAFRRVEPGINPELEMLRFLSEHGFEHIARPTGWYRYVGELMGATLGVVQEFVSPARDGWDLALEAVSTGDPAFVQRLRDLGACTGALHAALASDPDDPDFAPEQPGDETLPLLIATIDAQIERLFLGLPDLPALEPIAGRAGEVRDLLGLMAQVGTGGRLIRDHGDYHLGQTVLGPDGWVILDFEGEPGRPLVERRRKRQPLRDVAGMMRSFAYVASASEILRERPAPADWERSAREAFLAGYLAAVDASLLPAGPAAIERMLSVFELEKAIYELRYELNNRPDWVGVPVAGILRLLEQA
ncbi:MAG TPA: hypothetical protein VHX88_01655 [Solirubrobacteraceae bacterium]|jgi:predicted trehalose synthase|nr:hypothetical protein [Solirubrobacteraceae bacterium]